jgi:hypothetical protein
MFRKITVALVAATTLGAVALAPTSASAWGHRWGHGWGWGAVGLGVGIGLATGAIVQATCTRRMVVATPYGPTVQWVNVC